GEREDRRRGRGRAGVPCSRRAGPVAPDGADAGARRHLAHGRVARSRVDDEHLVVGTHGVTQRSERAGEESGAIARAQHDRDLRAAAPPDVLHLVGWGTARFARRAPDVPALEMPIDAWQLGYSTQFVRPAWRRAIEVGELAKVKRHERRHYPVAGAVVVVA